MPKTAGPISTIGAVRRGFGAPVAKSAELLSVSLAPSLLRNRAVVLLGAAALVLSAQLAVAAVTDKINDRGVSDWAGAYQSDRSC